MHEQKIIRRIKIGLYMKVSGERLQIPNEVIICYIYLIFIFL